jgi:hypothetical protein
MREINFDIYGALQAHSIPLSPQGPEGSQGYEGKLIVTLQQNVLAYL